MTRRTIQSTTTILYQMSDLGEMTFASSLGSTSIPSSNFVFISYIFGSSPFKYPPCSAYLVHKDISGQQSCLMTHALFFSNQTPHSYTCTDGGTTQQHTHTEHPSTTYYIYRMWCCGGYHISKERTPPQLYHIGHTYSIGSSSSTLLEGIRPIGPQDIQEDFFFDIIMSVL